MKVVKASGKLVTIRFSHYCDKARWALDHHGVPYVEAHFLPGLSAIGVALHGGLFSGRADRVSTRFSTPLWVGRDGTTLHDSAAISKWADDAFGTPQTTLYATPDVAALEAHYHDRLGAHTRRVAYSFLLKDVPLLMSMFEANSGALQTRAIKAAWPLVAGLISRLDMSPLRVTKSMDSIIREFDGAAERLTRHSGDYLLPGDRLSAADISFAALAAPVLVVQSAEGFGGFMPPVDKLPDAFQEKVRLLRAHEAGQFAMRLFRTHRKLPVLTGS